MQSEHPKRDVTIALNTVRHACQISVRGQLRYTLTELQHGRLLRILTDIDARTGRRDPSKRRKR